MKSRTFAAFQTNGRWISGIAISSGLDPGEQGLDRMLIDRIALNSHGFSLCAMSREREFD